jgi:hypothetical protein
MKNLLMYTAGIILIISGCVASMERYPGSVSNSKYAPSNSSSQSGLISYSSDDGKMAREDAYKKMYNACNGRYSIIGESMEQGDSVAMPLYGGGFIMANEKKVFIEFICD